MTQSFMVFPTQWVQGGLHLELPATRGPFDVAGLAPRARQRLLTDSIGSMTLTLTNVVIGSRVRIEYQAAGTLADERTATGATEVFTIPYYSTGNASNNLRIKVRKGTVSPFYQPYETLAVASTGSQSIYVSQIPDE